MLAKINLSVVCFLSVMFFGVGPCLAVNVSIEPSQIILNAEGNSADNKSTTVQTIQASIADTGMVTNCEATLTIKSGAKVTEQVMIYSFQYCIDDDILHIRFDREDVLAALEDAKIGSPEGDLCEAAVSAKINGETTPSLEGSGNVTVIDPEKSPK